MKKENISNENTVERMQKRKGTSRQAAAIIGVALLALLYVATLIAAIADSSSSGIWFRASLFATMALPLLLWIYVWIYGKLTGKRTLTDPPSSTDSSPSPDETACPDGPASSGDKAALGESVFPEARDDRPV